MGSLGFLGNGGGNSSGRVVCGVAWEGGGARVRRALYTTIAGRNLNSKAAVVGRGGRGGAGSGGQVRGGLPSVGLEGR